MKERPIIFNGEMVRAILNGRKTQTRRVIKLRRGSIIGYADTNDSWPVFEDQCGDWHSDLCPLGQPGDRLWVRESAFISAKEFVQRREGTHPEGRVVSYSATTSADGARQARDYGVKLTPSIHMPRWVSRITLEITGVCVERLQEASEEDAKAEGVLPNYAHRVTDLGHPYTARPLFQNLWDSLAKPGNTWADNPWVWVIEFKKI